MINKDEGIASAIPRKESQETFSEIIRGEKPVLVDFTAEWCGPCRMMKPILEELHVKMGEQVRILKVDIDKSPLVSSVYHVSSVPTLILFQKGNILWRQSGVIPAGSLQKIITQLTTQQ
jgi:thioredoxin 1